MALSNLTPVGVELIAEGSQQFTANVGKAAQSLTVLERAGKSASAAVSLLSGAAAGTTGEAEIK